MDTLTFRPRLRMLTVFFGLASAAGAMPVAAELAKVELVDSFMGGAATITAWAEPGVAAEPVLAKCREELRRLEQVFSPYRQGSAVNELNQFAGSRPVKVSPEVITVLQWSKGITAFTHGAWDITTAVYAWDYGFGQGDYRVPPPARLDYLKTFVGVNNLVIYPQDKTVVYKRDGVQIDLDGLLTNHALDRMTVLLDSAHLPAARVALGQGLAVLGAAPAGGSWLENLPDAVDPRRALAAVALAPGKLMWARAADHSFIQAGKKYYPILDPQTGEPARFSLGVCLWLPRSPAVNLPAAALMLMPSSDALALVNSIPGAQACILDADGQVEWSPGWKKDEDRAR